MQAVARHARRVKTALIMLALITYGIAYYTWTLGQSLGAVVVAVFGYLVLRSRAKLSYELTWRHFRRHPAVLRLLQALDADSLAQGESAMRRRLQEQEVESSINE